MFGYVQKLPIAHLIPLKTINIVGYNKFSNYSTNAYVYRGETV